MLRRPAFALIPACLLLLLESARPTELRDPILCKVYHSLRQPLLDDSSYVVSDTLRIELPDFLINLTNGQLLPLRDSTGALTGLLFEGKAHVRFAPRHHLERQQLYRFVRDSILTCDASTILWRFVHPPPTLWSLNNDQPINLSGSPSVEDSLLKMAPLGERMPRTVAKLNSYAANLPNMLQKELLQRRGFNLAAYLLSGKYANEKSEFIACAFLADEPHSLSSPVYLYLHEPAAHESIQFLQYLEKGLGHPFYIVCSYPLGPYFTAPKADSVRLTKYNGWVEVNPNGRMTADMGVDIFTAQQKLPVLFFQLSSDLAVTRVTSEAGDTLDFIQEKKEAGLTVFLPETVAGLDTIRLLFHYDGNMLQKNGSGILFLKDTVFWVPHLDYLRRAVYKIIFKYPPSMRVLAVGKLAREWEEGGYRLSFYHQTMPVKAASFCLGRFSSDTLIVNDLPDLEIHSTRQRNTHQRKEVAADIANSLFLFGNLLATHPSQTLRIIEAPGLHSQGFPGFVTLSWIGFHGHLEGAVQALRSHEVAHQWFGNAIGWATYHDQWLSEAFAEYLGALYLEWVMQDRRHFEQLIQAWRDDLLSGGSVGVSLGLRRFGLSKNALKRSEGITAGPLWMGIRLGQKETLDYYLQNYIKGAYVLHMLRWLLRDLKTGSDATFWQLLSDFGQTYWEADPATQDFQRIAEKHYGESLDWFFKQWVYGTTVPTYRWRYRAMQTDSGDVVRVFIEQENVPPDFRMPIPVTVEYADGVRVSQRVWVTHEGSECIFPARRAKARELFFNEGEAVLCRVKAR